MDSKQLIELVEATSLALMNGGGDGTIIACWDDGEILEEFGRHTVAQIVAKVVAIDGATLENYNEMKASSDMASWLEYGLPLEIVPTCNWLVGDSPNIRTCGATVYVSKDNWVCEAGHRHYTDDYSDAPDFKYDDGGLHAYLFDGRDDY